MTDKTFQDQDKVDEYLNVIRKRILDPIEKTEVREYCTATLLLLFAAIDGMGKLLHPDYKAQVVERIRAFLEFMDGDYEVYKEQLLELRNSLVHNALSVFCFLSRVEDDPGLVSKHLKVLGAPGFIYVHTVTMVADFENALQRFRTYIKDNPAMMRRAADRLEWWVDIPSVPSDIAVPSPPDRVRFIFPK